MNMLKSFALSILSVSILWAADINVETKTDDAGPIVFKSYKPDEVTSEQLGILSDVLVCAHKAMHSPEAVPEMDQQAYATFVKQIFDRFSTEFSEGSASLLICTQGSTIWGGCFYKTDDQSVYLANGGFLDTLSAATKLELSRTCVGILSDKKHFPTQENLLILSRKRTASCDRLKQCGFVESTKEFCIRFENFDLYQVWEKQVS